MNTKIPLGYKIGVKNFLASQSVFIETLQSIVKESKK